MSAQVVHYPAFNKQKKWKQLQEQELLIEKSSSNTLSVNKSGRKSPSKFSFTQKPKDENKSKSNTLIKHVLTMEELEKIHTHTNTNTHTHGLSRSPSPSVSPISSISISPEPITNISKTNISKTNTQQKSKPSARQRQRSSQSQSPNPIDIDIDSSTMTLHKPIHKPIPSRSPSRSPIHQQVQVQQTKVQPKQDYHIVPISPEPRQMTPVSISPEPRQMSPVPISHGPLLMSPVPMSPVPMSPVSLFAHKYNLHTYIITKIKELVFQHSSLICGGFNSQQFVINEFYKAFQYYIISYEHPNNMKFTSQQINYLFIDETISPETKKRLDLQKSIEILTTGNRMNSFIDSINHYFTNVHCPYKIEHINRGNIKTIVDQAHDLQYYSQNHDGNELFLHIVKISIPEYSIVFEVRFLILENEKRKLDKSYVIPLCIPEGLYDAEHLHIINNGNDVYSIQHSSSTIEFIVNNINMKIVSLMPKLNDYDYTKIAKYIHKLIPTSNENPYLYEFDIFNTIHKKSDFLICNKNKEEHEPHSCEKCNINISTNARYVIAKCCHKKYHIECMEMNYYPLIDTRFSFTYSYLVCDCGCTIIDEKSCNSRLLLALFRNYY
jgi:hypothetical protein